MKNHNDATARQLDFDTSPDRRPVGAHHGRPGRLRAEGPVLLCVVCGRSRARLTLDREPGHAPAKLCLRCHHGVMQQRKMVRAGLPSHPRTVSGPPASSERPYRVAGDVGLIVPRASALDGDAKYDLLTRRRRRAQVAARRALSSDVEHLPGLRPSLLDRAS